MRRSSVNFRGGHKIFARKIYVLTSAKCPNFTRFLAENLSKYPNFYDICPKNLQENSRILHDFARKMPKFYIIIARKILFSRILGGHVPKRAHPCPPSPTPQRRIDGGIWVYIPSKSVQVNFLWGKNDVRTAI